MSSEPHSIPESISLPVDSQQHVAPHPPPFNPMPSHNNQPDVVVLENSVVPDLMKVYESMTQSSTPQDPNDPPASDPTADPQYGPHAPHNSYDAHQYPPAPASQQPQQPHYYPADPKRPHYYAAPPGSYEGPSPPVIPPVPDYPPVAGYLEASTQPPPFPAPSGTIPDVALSSSASLNGRSLRKRSLDKDSSSDKSNAKARKKGNTTDGRWSKRFTWPDDLHRDFVSSIFDVGLKHSSPSAILDHMPKNDKITSERVKSHLQKYRVHRTKSKKEFMASYDASLSKFKAGGSNKNNELADGEVAAHLSHSIMTDADTAVDDKTEEATKEEEAKEPPKPKDTRGKIILPQLSEDEKKSPIGVSLGYLMGLFFSLHQQLMAQRAGDAAAAAPSGDGSIGGAAGAGVSQVGSVYSHFASGVPQNYPQNQNSTAEGLAPAPHDDTPAPAAAQAYNQDPTVDPKHDGKAPPSTRTNFEQNKLMKREMQSQMAFQNKMRDLKQRELNKYTSAPELPADHDKEDDTNTDEDDLTPNPVGKTTYAKDASAERSMSRSQGTGEAAEDGDSAAKGRPRGLSVGDSDDFWNTDVVDEQLFEFLMNP